MTNAIVKNQLQLFVLANIDKPSFDAQMKEQLTTRASEFGTKPKYHTRWVYISTIHTTSTPCRIVTRVPLSHAHLSFTVSMDVAHNYQRHGTNCHSVLCIST